VNSHFSFKALCRFSAVLLGLAMASSAQAQMPVLLYHAHPNLGYVEANFTRDMDFLVANDYKAITPDEFMAWKNDNAPLPMRPVLLTVDDNYILVYTSMWPILQARGLKIVNFTISASVGQTAGLHYCSWAQINQMEQSGAIISESHTVTHPHLSTLTRTQQRAEVVNSRAALNSNMPGKNCKFIAYSYGDYNAITLEECATAGYTGGFVVGGGINTHDTPDLELQRKQVDTVTFDRFKDDLGFTAFQTAPGPGWVMDDSDVHFYADETQWPVIAGSSQAGGSGRIHVAGAGAPAEWSAFVPRPGVYRVHARWSSVPARSSAATYTVNHAGGSTSYLVNQRINGDVYNLLGEVQFTTAQAARVSLAPASDGSVNADAVWLEFVSSGVNEWGLY
jgi:peptidoglycan/xylan/chitin deacetylase (PgdA/CDA1 family)